MGMKMAIKMTKKTKKKKATTNKIKDKESIRIVENIHPVRNHFGYVIAIQAPIRRMINVNCGDEEYFLDDFNGKFF